MAQVDNAKPIWLDLKKEYIDDNFDALLNYINNNKSSAHDPFYNITLNLVGERVEEVLKSISSQPLYLEDIAEEELIFNIRLLACCLLTFPNASDRIKVMLALLHDLRILVPKYAEDLINITGNCLKYENIDSIGVSYSDIIQFKKEIFAYKLCKGVKFSRMISGARSLDGRGRVWQNADGLTITAPGERSLKENIEALAFSLDTGIGCRLGSFKGEHLKASESSVFPKMVDFITNFIKEQEQPLSKPKQKKKLSYASGDSVVVRVIDIVPKFSTTDETKFDIIVETTDDAYERLEGKIVYSGPYLGVYVTDLMYRYIQIGDYIRADVMSPEGPTFSYEKYFKEFFVEDTRREYGYEEPMYAELITHIGKYFNWLGERGASISTYSEPGFELHDLAKLTIKNYETGKNYGKIIADIDGKVSQQVIVDDLGEEFNNPEIRKDAVRAFIGSTPLPEVKEQKEEETLKPDEELLPYLMRIFYIHQRNLSNPAERLRYLANAMALAVFMSDNVSLRFLQFAESYLRAIVGFAVNDNIHDIELPEIEEFADSESVNLRREILELLKEYGKSENSQKLNEAITMNPEEQPLLSKLARLIHAANSVRETLSAATLNALKREIVKTLSIETEEDVAIDSETRPYLGTESQTVEFKTSLVYPPDNNMQPNLSQQSANIFKAICGFLNSSIGGTLYIGVNDQGYLTGLSQDMQYLKCHNFDTFARVYIMDPMIRLFGKDAMTYVHIDSGYDGEVAIIKVEPFPFGVVEMNGVSYVRVDRETREMTDRVKAQITHEKLLKDREKADNLRKLQQAKYARCRAVLHDYASSNGGTISDRVVEVYDVLPEDGLAACFDCGSRTCKFFSIGRMKYVEVTDKGWENQHLHKNMEIDSFRISGQPKYSVSLQLDLHAKNLLTEQYPRTEDDLKNNANDTNIWYYSAKVAGLDALARFYVGLADHIQIIEAPELRKYVDDYIAKHLK